MLRNQRNRFLQSRRRFLILFYFHSGNQKLPQKSLRHFLLLSMNWPHTLLSNFSFIFIQKQAMKSGQKVALQEDVTWVHLVVEKVFEILKLAVWIHPKRLTVGQSEDINFLHVASISQFLVCVFRLRFSFVLASVLMPGTLHAMPFGSWNRRK